MNAIPLNSALRRAARSCVSLAVCLIAVTTARSATVVDWLTFTPGANRSHFSLVNDSGGAIAQAEVTLTSGIFAPLSPSAGLLQAHFWVTPPDFLDSTTAAVSLTTTKVQVAPQGGSVQYQVSLNGADFSGMVFSVGQLFGSGGAGTRQVRLSAFTGGGASVPISLLGTRAYDDGLRPFDQPIVWDAAQQTLSPAASASGETAFSFFGIGSAGAPVTRLVIGVPNGHTSPAGDAIELAFAVPPIPEPAGILFGLAIAGVCCNSRKTKR